MEEERLSLLKPDDETSEEKVEAVIQSMESLVKEFGLEAVKEAFQRTLSKPRDIGAEVAATNKELGLTQEKERRELERDLGQDRYYLQELLPRRIEECKSLNHDERVKYIKKGGWRSFYPLVIPSLLDLREKRFNKYTEAGLITPEEKEELLKRVREFRSQVETFGLHPTSVKEGENFAKLAISGHAEVYKNWPTPNTKLDAIIKKVERQGVVFMDPHQTAKETILFPAAVEIWAWSPE